MIRATFAARGAVEGHAAGMRDPPGINALAAAGMVSDHEAATAEEAWDTLRRGLFLETRPHAVPDIFAGLPERGLRGRSRLALAARPPRLRGGSHQPPKISVNRSLFAASSASAFAGSKLGSLISERGGKPAGGATSGCAGR
jgi:hypothetical protein